MLQLRSTIWNSYKLTVDRETMKIDVFFALDQLLKIDGTILCLSTQKYANVDLKTQEAYELAVKGLLRPMEKTPPVITAIRCLRFTPPEFQLEIHCLHETQQYLRKIVHEIGLELKSTAVCTQVRRVRDGVFTLDDALLRTQWNLQNIQNAILQSKLKVQTELQRSLVLQESCGDFDGQKGAGLSQPADIEHHRRDIMEHP